MNKNLSPSLEWYVLYTLPNYEKKVHLSLTKNQITTFLPLQKVVRKWSDRQKIIEVPLFPNYVFIRTHKNERFKALDVYGVKYYINSGGRPALISENEINNIKKMLECPGIDIEQNLSNGNLVTIISGPFKNMNGILFEKRGQTRFAVKLESINQILSIEICSSCVRQTC
jgi:transcription antitermination factor NusG